MMSDWTGLALWFFLPNIATSTLLSQYYRMFVPPANVPSPITRRYRVHRNNMYILVIVAYLIYSLGTSAMQISAAAQQGGSFYVRLNGLTPLASQSDIRTQYRRLSLVYHPDKYQSQQQRQRGAEDGGAQQDREFAEKQFIQITSMYKVLSDPVARRAYDNFGVATVVGCRVDGSEQGGACRTYGDFLGQYVKKAMLPYYMGTAFVLLLMSLFRTLSFGTLWYLGYDVSRSGSVVLTWQLLFGRRYIMVLNMAVLELYLVTHPSARLRVALSQVLHGLTISDLIALLHQMFTIVLIAVNQLGPIVVSGVHSLHLGKRRKQDDAAADEAHDQDQTYVQSHTLADFQTQLEPLVRQTVQLATVLRQQATEDIRRTWEPFRKSTLAHVTPSEADQASATTSPPPTDGDAVPSSSSNRGPVARRLEQQMQTTLVDQMLYNSSSEYRQQYSEALQRIVNGRASNS
ncbi:hypothetical protein RI367_001186 [Sorochytrium milnesiophthora]